MLACTAAATRPLVARRLVTRASAATAGTEQRTLKALNITRSTLIDSNGGRAVRNVDGDIYEVVYVAENDSVKVLCKSQQLEYATELPYFWTALAETINGRVAMVALAALLVEELVRGVPAL